ncbi:MAG: hypothetical protein O2887_07525 [Bacteroidetes bacterium]|nr:hypothetical protein [Bacteroidota bacterium]MDA1120330.1 hypothetical protein [Bacteroidota bacterium]
MKLLYSTSLNKYRLFFIQSLTVIVLLLNSCSLPEIETIAGTGVAGTLDGPAMEARLNNPFGIVRGPDNALWFCEYDGHTVRKIDAAGEITTIVGNGEPGHTGDGGSAIEARLNRPHEIRFDSNGQLYIADMSNHAIRKVDLTTGQISTIAGMGDAGFSGDGGPAIQAHLNQSHSIQFGPDGNLYIADVGNHRVRVIDMKTGLIRTLAGNGETSPTPDGKPFRDVPLNGPRSLDFGKRGDLWLVLKYANQIYRLDMGLGTIHHIAGTGELGFTGNGGDARLATLSGPKGIAIAPNGNVYVADTESHSVRMIDTKTGIIDVVVGTGERFDGKDGDPLQCGLARPHGIFVEKDGTVLIGDSENHRIRLLRP